MMPITRIQRPGRSGAHPVRPSRPWRPWRSLSLLVSVQLSLGSTAFVAFASAVEDSAPATLPIQLAQVDDSDDDSYAEEDAAEEATPEPPTDSAGKPPVTRPLEPRYQPRPPVEKSWYNDSYLFGMTRGVADSTIAPAGKVPLFFLTVPLDIVFLPFAAIGGLFG